MIIEVTDDEFAAMCSAIVTCRKKLTSPVSRQKLAIILRKIMEQAYFDEDLIREATA
jgi:hypothetical protein